MTVYFSLAVGLSFAQDPQNLPESNPPYRTELKTLAGRILKRADKAKCHPGSCTVLVANFTTPSGSTSRLGIQLADSVAAEFVALGGGIKVADRSRLQDYLVREHIPSDALKDREAARWLATEFHANVVLIGTIEQLGDHFNLLTELLNISNEGVGPQEAMRIAIQEPREAFAPFERYDAERFREATTPEHTSPPMRAGANGATVPECIHCPPPEYTDTARKVKFTGTVVLMVTVTEEGRASDIAIIKGVPFGLNEAAIKAASAWSFRPATYGGRPIAVRVPIESTFRLY
ncbi:MAG TPA: energy transducer TonB [Candidatus Acidoferrum sp.]|nr:energy transducer TonB [Candidatus Acidoferrum sp.]